MFIKELPNYVVVHSVGVAKFMAEWASLHPKEGLMPDEMYILGLLHDIGKIYPANFDMNTGKEKPNVNGNIYKGHAHKGGSLLSDLGFHFAKEVEHHGDSDSYFFSVKLLLLNLADLSVNGEGNIISIKERIDDVGVRYGLDSEEYRHCINVVGRLEGLGWIDKDWNVL